MNKNWDNVVEWTNDIPISFLPFYVWCASANNTEKIDFCDEEFDDLYIEFIRVMELRDSEAFKYWCSEQFTHFYECSH